MSKLGPLDRNPPTAPGGFARRHLLDRAVRIIAEIDQIGTDCAHWNRTHPDEPPIDPDPDGALRDAQAHAMRVVERLSEAP